jgi:hypothetical protein
MKKNYNSMQVKIYSDYRNCSTEKLTEMINSNKYADGVIEIINDILNERGRSNIEEKKTDSFTEIIKCPYCGQFHDEKIVKCDCGYYLDKEAYNKNKESFIQDFNITNQPKSVKNASKTIIILGCLYFVQLLIMLLIMSKTYNAGEIFSAYLGFLLLPSSIIIFFYLFSGILLSRHFYWSRIVYTCIAIIGSLLFIQYIFESSHDYVGMMIFFFFLCGFIFPLLNLYSKTASFYFSCLKKRRSK